MMFVGMRYSSALRMENIVHYFLNLIVQTWINYVEGIAHALGYCAGSGLGGGDQLTTVWKFIFFSLSFHLRFQFKFYIRFQFD